MFQYDEQEDENIILCINCDAEYTITKIDDEEQEAEFCPYCGYHQIEDEYDEYDDEEDDEDNTLQ